MSYNMNIPINCIGLHVVFQAGRAGRRRFFVLILAAHEAKINFSLLPWCMNDE
jgi:hypothetical protein